MKRIGMSESTAATCAKIHIMAAKTGSQDFPYKPYLNILHGPLELIDVQKLADACKDKWHNQTLCQVNDSVVQRGVLEGDNHRHEHNDGDELFSGLDGNFLTAPVHI